MSSFIVMNKPLTIKQKKKILSEIAKLTEIEHIEIFKIFDRDNINYTENRNGIFINISKTPNETLHKVKEFLAFCKNNNEFMNQTKIERTKLMDNYFKKENEN
tara:strand:- start:1042 stop:1350 length:309 start_codon:yes stop_codon:yes gene_type:complete